MSDTLDPMMTGALDAQQQADEARLRGEMARIAFLTAHFDQWLQSEFARTQQEYDAILARRKSAGAMGASPTGA